MRKPAPPREIPPPLELCCLRALWRIGEGTVHEVRDAVRPEHDLAYTTVLTLLDRLARRGFAGRRKRNRAFLYSPLLEEARSREIAVQDLLSSWFGGDRGRLISYLEGNKTAPTGPPPPQPPAAEVESRIDTALL